MLPLGLDSFAVASAIGASQALTVWQRLRISLVFVIFDQAVITKAGQLDGTTALLWRTHQPPASPLKAPADNLPRRAAVA